MLVQQAWNILDFLSSAGERLCSQSQSWAGFYYCDPGAGLRKAQGAELKLGDSCRNWKPESLNIDALKSQPVPLPCLNTFLHMYIHTLRSVMLYAHLHSGPNLPAVCLYTCQTRIKHVLKGLIQKMSLLEIVGSFILIRSRAELLASNTPKQIHI